jgi:DNA-binding NtrC family response regulator
VIPRARSARDAKAAEHHARALLVVAPGETDRDALYLGLAERDDFQLRFAASAAEAARALQAAEVVLLIASPEVPTTEVTQLLATKALLRPELPLLVIRNRQAEEPPAWALGGVGVLRCPLLPAALSRSVEVVLGLAGPRP